MLAFGRTLIYVVEIEKSVQQFQRYFIHKQKTTLMAPKPEPSTVHYVW